MEQWFSIQTELILIGVLSLVMLIIFIQVIVLGKRVGIIRRQFNQLTTGTSKENLEQLLDKLFAQIGQLHDTQALDRKHLNNLESYLLQIKGNVGIVRYNAFQDTGHDLSFSVAILDQSQNGVVVTSIYGREESRVYAKPLSNGTSQYNLSDEERAAIKIAAESAERKFST